ncbi:MAG: hypothetical protein M1839_005482 [Geoglossum umbratile]|nr:MAG: hypothetical protein M1839_005482 [Geoglossum umbratile]
MVSWVSLGDARASTPYHFITPTSKPRPTYFIPAIFDNPPPPTGPLKLGQMITKVEDPGTPIDPSGPEDLADNNIEIQPNSVNIFRHMYSDRADTTAGLFFTALQSVALKLHITFDRHTFIDILDEIDTLDVEFIQVNNEYVQKSMERPAVKAFLKKPGLRKRVYMITGIKTAKPKAKMAIARGANATTEGTGEPFVYGYRLRQCYYGVLGGIKHSEYTKRALLSNVSSTLPKDENEVRDEDNVESLVIVFQGVAEEDLTPEELGAEGFSYKPIPKV